MRDKYRKQVELLIRIMPSVFKIKEFAVHGGTAINLFHKDLQGTLWILTSPTSRYKTGKQV